MPRSPMDQTPQRVLVHQLKRAIDVYTRERDRVHYRERHAEPRRLRSEEIGREVELRAPSGLDPDARANPSRHDDRPPVLGEEMREHGSSPTSNPGRKHPEIMADEPRSDSLQARAYPDAERSGLPSLSSPSIKVLPGAESGVAALAVTRVRKMVEANPHSARSTHVIHNLGMDRVRVLEEIIGEPLPRRRAGAALPVTTEADS